jgi:hypothetical protein
MKKLLIAGLLAIVLAVSAGAFGADFNGDGYDDIAIFRPSVGLWAIRGQGNYYFGQDGDIPAPGKWTQTAQDEICVFRPSNGLWATRSGARAYYGDEGDIPIGASGASSGSGGLWSQIGSDIYYDSGYVGIGPIDPRFNLDIHQNSSYWSYLRFTNTTTGTTKSSGSTPTRPTPSSFTSTPAAARASRSRAPAKWGSALRTPTIYCTFGRQAAGTR